MGSMSRNKGASGEREVVHLIQIHAGAKMRRKLSQYQQQGDCDLEPADQPSAERFGRYAIEVKRRASMSHATRDRFWLEAERQAGADKEPILFFRGDREPWRVRFISQGIPVEAPALLWLKAIA